MIFYDYKKNILADKAAFDEEQSIIRGVVELTEDKTYMIKLYNRDAKIFYRKELLPENFEQNIRYTVIIQNSATEFVDDPENNEYVSIEKENDFIYMLENYSEFFVMCMPYIQIYHSAKINDLIVRMSIPSVYYEVSPIETTDSFSDIVKSNDSTYSADLKRKGKKALHKKLEPRNSLSYIEAQLDLITKMMFTMVDDDKNLQAKLAERIPNLAAYRKAIEENYIFNIKAEANCLEEIREGKAKVRQVQEDYYKIR